MPVALSGDGTFDAPALAADVRAAVAACIASLPNATNAAAVAELHLTTFVGNLLAVDASGHAVSPLYTYAQRHQPPQLSPAAAAAHYDRTGTPVHSAYAAAFASAHRASADAAAAVDVCCWTGLSGYLLAGWAGVHPLDVGLSASEAGWAGLLRLHGDALYYDDGALALSGVSRAQLPPIRGEDFSLVVPLAALLTGGPPAAADGGVDNSTATVRVTLAIGDGAAATVGSLPRPWRAHADGSVFALTVGTSAALRVALPRSALLRALCACATTAPDAYCETEGNTAAADAAHRRPHCTRCGRLRLSRLGLWAYPFADGVVLVGGALTDGGILTAHVAAALGTSPAAVTEARNWNNTDGGAFDADSLRPSPVLCLPFWSGERSTGWQGGARGLWAGLDYANTRPAALLHAAMDGVAFRLRAILDALRTVVAEAAAVGACDGGSSSTGGVLTRGVCSGGGLDPRHNPLFAAILATVLDAPLYIQRPPPQGHADGPGGATSAYDGLELTTRGLAEFHAAAGGHDAAAAPALELVCAAGDEARRAYALAYLRHQRLYDAMHGVDLSG